MRAQQLFLVLLRVRKFQTWFFEKLKKIARFFDIFARVEKSFWRLARMELEVRTRALRCMDACAALVFDFASRAQVSNLIFANLHNKKCSIILFMENNIGGCDRGLSLLRVYRLRLV